MTDDEEWLHFLDRWHRLLDGLQGRLPEHELEEIRFEGRQEPMLGISGLLGGHEQALWDLTPAEEDELWDLASLVHLDDEDVMTEDIRARSVRNRPIRKVRPRRPLSGGGHGARTGQPGKRVFPASWSDDDAIRHTMSVARDPLGAVKLPTGEWLAHGERDGVLMRVVVSTGGDVLTSYPVQGPGVTQNPTDEHRGPAAERLGVLLDAVLPSDHEARSVLDELYSVGEWPYVIAGLRALDLPMSSEQRTELMELAGLSYRDE